MAEVNKIVTTRDYDSEFIKELLDRHIYWKSIGQTEKAEAYQVLLHNFTKIEIKE